MNYPILVMAAIIEDKGKFLLTQRPKGVHNEERWEFPGGKIDFGEDPRYAMEREIEEELGIDIETGDILELSSHVYDETKHIVLIACHCRYISGKIKKKQVRDFRWVRPEEMMDFDITEADLLFVKKLLEITSRK
ncbi:NUDIX domain-containing protein [Candidatus Woesearchaeota archaeon]|nr:NUDIX domain-containing protein [Candidatus Woesearchaeota archaeon]